MNSYKLECLKTPKDSKCSNALQPLMFLYCGKEAWVWLLADDVIKLAQGLLILVDINPAIL